MSDRLISADKAKEVLKHLLYETAMDNDLDIADIYEDIAEKRLNTWIELIPTVDAVEVVRCKDCKWYKESKHSELRPIRFCYRLRNNDGVPVGYNWDDNDFCSYGERKEDADK